VGDGYFQASIEKISSELVIFDKSEILTESLDDSEYP
jgi:hypothetical protein